MTPVLISTLLLLLAAGQCLSSKTKMIIDTDGGIDDAESILLAASMSDSIDLLAVTVTSGITVDPKLAARNVKMILSAINRTDIPVFVGSSSLLGYDLIGHPLGFDGFADVMIEEDPNREGGPIMEEHASNAIVRLTKAFPGEIRIVALGPVTNLALAVKLDPQFLGRNVHSIHLTGGNRIPGKHTREPTNEPGLNLDLNFVVDPEAVHILLEHSTDSNKLVILPYDTCFANANKITLLRRKWLTKFDKEGTRLVRLAWQRMGGDDVTTPPRCDSFTLASAANPRDVIRAEGIGSLRIELFEPSRRGLLVSRHQALPNNVRLIFEIDFPAEIDFPNAV